LFSTQPPPSGLICHSWSQQAMARTIYLASRSIPKLLAASPKLPFAEIAQAVARDGKDVLRDVVISIPAAQRLIEECRARGITHVHAHSCGRAAMVAAIAQRLGGLDYSLTLHGPLQDYGPGQPFKWRNARFATIITQKLLAEMQAEMARDLPQTVVVQGMGVDTQTMRRSAPYRPPDAGETLRIFTCARLNLVKGHQDLIDAVGLLRDQGTDVQLEIAGEDDDGGNGFRAVLEDKIRDLNLENHVTLLGAIDESEVRARLGAAHLFVLASWAEPLGVAYMEAMSCATPVIGTDAGGVPELIENGVDGILVPPQDPGAIAAAIADLAAAPAELVRLSAAGRETIEKRFDSVLGAKVLMREIWKA
jgi:glycosyltransferase involved in cell wall biosynthesis